MKRISNVLMFIAVALLGPWSSAHASINLIRNGGFEIDSNGDKVPDGWDQEYQKGAVGRIDMTTDQVASGHASLEIRHVSQDKNWVRSSQVDIPAKPASAYRLSLKVKSDGPVLVLLYEYATGGNYITHKVADGKFPAWQTVGAAVRTGDKATKFKISLIVPAQGTAWFDDVELSLVAERPVLRAVRTATPPRIDGKLDDAVWQTAPESAPFYLLNGEGKLPPAPTTARVLFDNDALYVGFTCTEPSPDLMRRDVKENGGPVYTDDAVEFFVAESGQSLGLRQFDVSSLGFRFNGRKVSAKFNTTWYGSVSDAAEWNPQWEAKTDVGKSSWTAEMKIPWDALGSRPQFGVPWSVNFTRLRYVAGEELSTWAYLSGDTFHQPQYFGVLIFSGGDVRPGKVVTRPADRPDESFPVMPRPQWSQRGLGSLEMGVPFQVRVENPADRDLVTLIDARTRQLFGQPTVLADDGSRGPVVLLRRAGKITPDSPLARVPDSARDEAYHLLAGRDVVRIEAVGRRGLWYGLQTWLQLLQTDGHNFTVPQIEIVDWPDQQWRAWHMAAPLAGQENTYRRWIDTLATLKFNTLIFEVDHDMKFDRRPEISAPNAISKQDMRAIVQYAKERCFEVIPQIETFGHFNYVLNVPKYEDLAENPEATGPLGRWNFCPRNPDVYPVLFDMYEECIEVFQPHYFHIGEDEVTFGPIGTCSRCKGTPPAELFDEQLNKIYTFLKGKGLQVMMWGDQFLKENNGGPPHNTYLALDKAPKDIIICDWHYGPSADFPSVDFFKQKGFRVLGCGWYNPVNIYNFSNKTHDTGSLGYMGTSWWAPTNFENSCELEAAFAVAAENAWSNRNPKLEQVDYSPVDITRNLAGLRQRVTAQRFETVDLSAHFNQSLTDTPRKVGAFGLGPDYDLRNVPRGLQWMAGVPFQIAGADVPYDCVMLRAAGDPETFLPQQIWQISVGAKVAALDFLHTCSAPKTTYPGIYDRYKNYPKQLGEYIIHYVDGSEERIPIDYRESVTDWNSELPGAHMRLAWQGKTLSGARAMLASYRWVNRKPDMKIESVDMEGTDSPLRVALIAFTAELE